MEQITSRLQDVALKDISVTTNNPRKSFAEDHLKDLAESIRQKGVLQPVLLRPKGKKFEMVCGERRYRAAKMAVTVFSLYSGDSWNGYLKDWLRDKLGLNKSYGGPDRKFWTALLAKIDLDLFFEAIRRYNLGKLTDGQAADRRTSARSEALYQTLHYYCPDTVNAIQQEQDEKAAKRISRTEERLAKLREELPKPAKKSKAKKDEPVLQDR